jgi:DnaJ family protein C protein 7
LEVAKDASEREIRYACHQKSPSYHPDRFIGSLFSDEQRTDAANKLNLMFEAVDILTNVYKKQLYDEGYGLEAIQKNFEDVEKATRHHDRHGQ